MANFRAARSTIVGRPEFAVSAARRPLRQCLGLFLHPAPAQRDVTGLEPHASKPFALVAWEAPHMATLDGSLDVSNQPRAIRRSVARIDTNAVTCMPSSPLRGHKASAVKTVYRERAQMGRSLLAGEFKLSINANRLRPKEAVTFSPVSEVGGAHERTQPIPHQLPSEHNGLPSALCLDVDQCGHCPPV